MKKREGEISAGKQPGIYFEKVSFDELAEDFLKDYRINQKKSLDSAQYRTNKLKESFEGMRVVDITTSRVQKYIEDRMNDASSATINRELAALKRMLNLGAQQTPPKVDRVPYIPMLKENNVRKGFFEHADFIALREVITDYLKGFVTFAYKVGWRVSEIEKLTWGHVDLANGIVRLETGETKNDEGRTVYLDDELMEIFSQQWEQRKMSKKLLAYVFPNENHTDRIKDFVGSWNRACREIGLGYGYKKSKTYVAQWEDKLPAGPTLHDFRRTAVRNMVRAGIPERVAMMVSGHKTRAVFDRYNIVNDTDLKLAAQRQQTYLESQTGTISGTVHNLDEKRSKSSID